MWCPLGFYTLHQVTDACEDAAAELVPHAQGKELVFVDEEKNEYDYENSNHFRRLVVEAKLLELFIGQHRHSACATSPTGAVLRLSYHVVRPVIFNHWLSFSEAFSRHPELLYVDIGSAKIDLSGTARRINDWAPDGGASHAETWQEQAFKDFSELDGWSICYPRDEVSISKADMLKLWESDRQQRDNKASATPKGRPRLQEAVKEKYASIFPNGHGQLTEKQVLARLSSYGIAASADTLRRALGKRV